MPLAMLAWDAGNGLSQEVYFKKRTDPTFTLYQTLPGNATSTNILDIEMNRLYDFKIVSKCNFNMQSESAVQSGALLACPDLNVAQTALSLTISFAHLGGDVSEYAVQLFNQAGDTQLDEKLVTAPVDSPSVTFDGLAPDTYYTVKVVPRIYDEAQKAGCSVTQRTLGCAPGYELAPDGTFCFRVEEVPAIAPPGGVPESTVAKQHDAYGTVGTYIYDPGYNPNGTGTNTRVPLSNPFWVSGDGSGAGNADRGGPLNRCGLWSMSESNNQDIGFSVCLDIPESKTYYVGIAGDNRCRILVNSAVRVDQDVAALSAQYGLDGQITFKVWHIYPITLAAGPNIIELIGHNDTGVAAMGAEIYNNTPAEIMAATGYGQLTMIFSTANVIGQPVQLGSDNTGFSCPATYSLAACQTPFVCRRLVTALPA